MGEAPPNSPDELTRASCGAITACVIGNFLCSAPIVNATFGAFLIPVTTEFGWSRTSFSFVLTLVAVIGVLSYPLAGRLADRIGVRRVLLFGVLAFAASVGAVGISGGKLLHFYVLYSMIAITMAFSSTVLLSRVVASWFVSRRGLMLGLTAGVGNGIGCAAMPMLTLVIIGHWGWRNAYHALGILIAAIGYPVFWTLMHMRPQAAGEDAPSDFIAEGFEFSKIRRDPLFWKLAAAIAIGAGTLTAVFTHVVPILIDRGFSIRSTSLAIIGLAFGSVVWQVGFGRVLDRVKTPSIAAPAMLVSLIGMFLLIRGQGPLSLLGAGVLIGIGSGTEFAMLPYAIARYFGLRSYSEAYGAIFGLVMLTTGVTPMVMDVFYDLFKSYDLAIGVIGGVLLATAFIVGRLPNYRFVAGQQIQVESADPKLEQSAVRA